MSTEIKENYIEAVGRRKTSVARVRITPASTTTYLVNGKKIDEYFDTQESRQIIKDVSVLVKDIPNFSVSIRVVGGGKSSQAEAIRHGLARAIVKNDPEKKKEVKDLGFLTRDSRMKERRKFGLKKARKSPQWSKR